jgi:PrtD family type I secretion system ABC transporter
MTPGNELKTAFRRCAGALLGVGILSGVINVLGLTGSIYMLQVYDRVLPSHSVPTLVGLTVVMVGLYAAYGLLDFVRLRLLVRIGNRLDRSLHQQVFAASLLLPLKSGQEGNRIQPIRDLAQIRSFVSGIGPTALFDLPWLPVYLVIIYMLHPSLGILATLGAAAVVLPTLFAAIFGRAPARRATESTIARSSYADAGRRNAEVIRAMGLSRRFGRLWGEQSQHYLRDQRKISDVVGFAGSLSRSLRMALQSLMLGLGAYLVIIGEASAGVIIASSIMLARSLAPVDIAVAHWKGFNSARQSYAQLKKTFLSFAGGPEPMSLPRPQHSLLVEGLTVAVPGQQKPIINNITFQLAAGAGLGVIGPCASGKSTLVRALVGAWTPLRGTVRLDQAALDQWDIEDLGRDIGYLPQDVELFDGTVAENICRFDEDADPRAIIAAAETAGVHNMILRLPEGFQTRVGEAGTALSAGQRQLVGLARALYGEPFLVVLDEPNSNLDSDGDVALATAIRSVRQRGGIAVVVTHRPSALANLDQLLVMAGGTMQAFGPKDEALAHVTRPAAEAAAQAQRKPDMPSSKDGTTTVVPLHDRR